MIGTKLLEQNGWNKMVGTKGLEQNGWNKMVGTKWLEQYCWGYKSNQLYVSNIQHSEILVKQNLIDIINWEFIQ